MTTNLVKMLVISEILIRSHEVKQEGYEVAHDGRVITIFSAPNYCDFTGNQAAFIRLRGDEMKPKFTQFAAVVDICLDVATSQHRPDGVRKPVPWHVLMMMKISLKKANITSFSLEEGFARVRRVPLFMEAL